MDANVAFWLACSIILFMVGLYGLVSRKDALRMIIAIEILVTAVNSAFITFGYIANPEYDPISQTYSLISLAVASGVIGLALALITLKYKETGTVDVSSTIKRLRW